MLGTFLCVLVIANIASIVLAGARLHRKAHRPSHDAHGAPVTIVRPLRGAEPYIEVS